jgi:8-oxo-dGTP pyrophosphatase MutT (NUDIX family)
MPKRSAGLLPYRWRDGRLEVFLVHPGGPFWANKDVHAWSVAKGEVEQYEDLLAAARREFAEETGLTLAGPGARSRPASCPTYLSCMCNDYEQHASWATYRKAMQQLELASPPIRARATCRRTMTFG